MVSTLTAEMVRGSLIPFVERAEHSEHLSPDEARELLVSCTIPTVILDHLAERLIGSLDRGVEGRQLAASLRELLGHLESCAQAYHRFRSRLESTGLEPEEKAEGIARLEATIRTADAIREKLSSLLNFLETSRPAVDPASLRAAGGERKAAEFVGLDEFVTRLRSAKGALR
jgi:hypothetical protein